ncbi:MAG: LysR family transcriptional regulator, partial [Pirellulales bacterium]|nr:LysR family transcriptional regulator [Pirellulales bacterium]
MNHYFVQQNDQMNLTSTNQRAGDLNIQQLHTFRLVIECGGYAAAAKESHLSVPAVWQHIRALEQAYEVKLFDRVGRGVKPTAAAKRLYQVVDETLIRLESTFDVVRHCSRDETIRLVTGVRMMLEDLAEPLARFRKRGRNQLIIRHGNSHRAEQLLLSGEADLAMTLAPGLAQGSDQLHYEPAYFVDFLAASKRNHAFAKTDSTSLRELVKHDLIVTSPSTFGRDALDQA